MNQTTASRIWAILSRAALGVLPLLAVAAFVHAQVPPEASLFELNYSKGVASFNRSDYQSAERFFQEALQARPEDRDAKYYLGQTLIRVGKHAQAEGLFRELLAVERKSGRALLGLGMSLYHQRRYDQAVEALKAAQQASPDDPVPIYFEGLAQYELGDYQFAISRLTDAMLLSPELAPEGHYHRGLAHLAQGVYDEARAEFEAVIAADPDSEAAQLSRQALQQAKPGAREAPGTAGAASAAPA